jgi:hypothetical protein
MRKNPRDITVETYTMGTVDGETFLELEGVFKASQGDMYGVNPDYIPQRCLQILYDRGFVTIELSYSKVRYVVPSHKAQQTMYLQKSNGCRVHEPREVQEGRLVVQVPEWAESTPALGKSLLG